MMTNRGRSVWLASVVVGMLSLTVALWQVALGLIPAAFAAESRLSEIQRVSASSIDLENTADLEGLYQQALQTRKEIEPARRAIAWAGRFSSALSWLPVARQELTAWAEQAQRAQRDLDAASNILKASSQMLEVYGEAQSMIASPESSTSSIQLLKERAQELEATFSESLDMIGPPGSGYSASLGLYIPPVRSLMKRLDTLEDQMLAAASIGAQVSELMVDLLEVAEAAQPFMNMIASDGAEQNTVTSESLKGSLARLNTYSISAREKADSLAQTLSDTGQAGQLTPQIQALDQTLDVLVKVSGAAMIGFEALEPAARLAESAEGGLLANGDGIAALFDSVTAHQKEISEAIIELEEAERTINTLLSQSETEGFSGGMSRISSSVSDLRTGLELLSSLAPVGGDILGVDGTKRYMVLGQSADELRGTGGFVSSIWVVTFEDGALSDIQYHDAVRVDDWEHLDLYPKGPPGLDTHMNAWVWLLRDVSWDPDFPTTARAAEDLFRLGQRQEVDGVFAINQWTLLRVVEAIGNLPSPDGGDPLTSRNLITTLEQGTDQHGRAYMDLVLQGLLDRLNRSASLATLVQLASALSDTLESRDLLVYFDNPEAQSVFSELGWAGGIRESSGDYLFIVDANVGWSKVDRNIQREARYSVDLGKAASGGRPRAALTLDYTNHSGPGSTGCEPQWLNRGKNYSQLKNACYWNLFRVYLPQGARLLSSTPLPLPEYSVAVDTGKAVQGEDTGGISSVHDKIVFSGLATLKAGENREINLVYDLPESVVQLEEGSLKYSLLIQKQPGVRQRRVSVEVMAPEGYGFVAASISPAQIDASRVRFVLDLEEDAALTIEFDNRS